MNGCDLVAVRRDELVVVELKTVLNLTLILQGVERLKLTDAVYLAIEEPRRGRIPHWPAVQQLCRRLGLGLLTVRFGRSAPRVEVICDPGPYRPKPASRKRRLLLGEFQRRSGDHNTGGSARGPRVTAYREEALRLADELNKRGPLRVKDLREATGCAEDRRHPGQGFLAGSSGFPSASTNSRPKGREALVTYAERGRGLGGIDYAELDLAGSFTGQGSPRHRIEIGPCGGLRRKQAAG